MIRRGQPLIDEADRPRRVTRVRHDVAAGRVQWRQQQVGDERPMPFRNAAQPGELLRRRPGLQDRIEQRPIPRDQRLTPPPGELTDAALHNQNGEQQSQHGAGKQEKRNQDPTQELRRVQHGRAMLCRGGAGGV